MNADVSFPVTITTAYFPIDGARASSHASEKSRIVNFLSTVESPIVVYCPDSQVSFLRAARQQLPITFKVVDDLWSLEPVRNWKAIYSRNDSLLDPDKHHYVPPVWAIYNSKLWMVQQVVNANVYRSRYFLWVDIGSQRTPLFRKHWPDVGAIDALLGNKQDNIIVSLIAPPHSDAIAHNIADGPNFHSGDKDTIQGTFFGGTATSIAWYAEEYYKLRSFWASQNRFLGMDQVIMKSVVFRNRDKVAALESYNGCGNKWFYFWEYFSTAVERSQTCQLVQIHKW